MSGVVVSVSISPCCDRLRYLSNCLTQAKNLNLNDTYMLELENLILLLVPLIKTEQTQAVVDAYDAAIDNILALRDAAFTEWALDVKNTYVPVPKTPIPDPPPE